MMFKQSAQWLFRVSEKVFHRVGGLMPLRESETHLFYIAKRRYLGKPFTVDGITVRAFDPVVELHMNNELLHEVIQSEPQLMGIAVRLLHEARRSFPLVAEVLQMNEFADAKVVYGVTFIHRGIQRFGFKTFPIQNRFTRNMTTWHLRNVFRMVNPDAASVFETHKSSFEPRLIAAAKDLFIERHLTNRLSKDTGVPPSQGVTPS